MKKLLLSIGIFISAILLFLLSSFKHTDAIKSSTKGINDNGFVIMELFTSQGCSSCPKAEELLGSYVQKNDSRIIPISFHVDYWNPLGWKDPFSMSQFSDRQAKYDVDFLHASIYTPQLIINGEKEFIGSNDTAIKKAVEDALSKTPLVIIHLKSNTISKDKITLGVPFYGYEFGPSLIKHGITLNYENIVEKFPGAELEDEITTVDSNTIYYNGIPTIKLKTQLAKEETSGIMIWQLSGDAPAPKSLLDAINDEEKLSYTNSSQ